MLGFEVGKGGAQSGDGFVEGGKICKGAAVGGFLSGKLSVSD